MCTIEQGCALIYLTFCTWVDIKNKTIPVGLLVLGAAGSLILRLYTPGDWWRYIYGILVGLFFLFISQITKEGLGYGDSILILIMGSFCGIWKIMMILFIAFTGAAIFSMGILIKRGMTVRKRFPFVPFLLLGYMGACIV